jgi:hypothetical protein
MRGQILRVASVILSGLILVVGVGLGVGSPVRFGEAVPDDVAANERGGSGCQAGYWLCAKITGSSCYDTNKTNNGYQCYAQKVVILGKTEGYNFNSECSAYCGVNNSGSGTCEEFPTRITTECAKSGKSQ